MHQVPPWRRWETEAMGVFVCLFYTCLANSQPQKPVD